VNVAPVIPGLTDEEIPAILKAASERGAQRAGYILMRLPGAVEPLFVDWVRRNYPDRAGRILNRVQDTRRGNMSDARFGSRMKGEGEIAGAINSLFKINLRKYNYQKTWEDLSTGHFIRSAPAQTELFER
jgi:DNA repair photolyase